MSSAGWCVMVLSVGSATCFFIWCIYKVCTIPNETEKLHGFDPETPDAKERVEFEKKRLRE
ncbi:MAG: hypothetical protein B7X06_02485 [Verrucomicrobia bacterium 21-51-4]|nr:MAG: hypothetical protein B7X06_02485 [Verrucomicrobia bacterium 21-51-4]